jgi:hypothetical protein
MATLEFFGLLLPRTAAAGARRPLLAGCAGVIALCQFGCTLIADVDRSKIPPEAAEFADAGNTTPPTNPDRPVPGGDAGVDAGRTDAAVTDAGTGGDAAAVSDAAVEAGASSGEDAGSDGS